MNFLRFCAAKIAGTVVWFLALIILISLIVIFPWFAYLCLAGAVLVLLLSLVCDWHEEYSRKLNKDETI